MTLHGLYPAYVAIDYHSTFAPHLATIPTRAWNPFAGTGGQGGYEAWDSSDCDAIAMVEDLVDAFLPCCSAELVFDKWTVYTLATPDAPPLPRAGGVFVGKAGTDGTPGWFGAVQLTYTFYDTAFETAKLILLDAASNNGFAPRDIGTLSADLLGPVTALTTTTSAWASRAENRPAVLRSCRFTINNKLQKEYYG